MQALSVPQGEYTEEEDVKVKTDSDPWMIGTAYGHPSPHPGDEGWDSDQSHAMIDVSPLLFETRDLETVDIKEYALGYPEASDAITASQATRTMHQPRNGRPRDDLPRTSPRDPRLLNRRLSVTPVDRLRDTDGPRMADTTNVAQGLMETSTDSDEDCKLVINLP